MDAEEVTRCPRAFRPARARDAFRVPKRLGVLGAAYDGFADEERAVYREEIILACRLVALPLSLFVVFA